MRASHAQLRLRAEPARQDWTAKRAMGRSKLYNNKEAKQLVAAQESLDQAPRGDLNRGGKGGVLGVKQRGKFVRDTRRPAKTENNWLHGVLFVVIAGIIVAWALGY